VRENKIINKSRSDAAFVLLHSSNKIFELLFSNDSGSIYEGGSFPPGPSPDDRAHARKNVNGVRNVVIDSKYIYLVNGNIDEEIKIERKR
jgi:hypothetical protein